MKAAAYIRVSTEDQAKEGISLEMRECLGFQIWIRNLLQQYSLSKFKISRLLKGGILDETRTD